jgi:hypothetical protein
MSRELCSSLLPASSTTWQGGKTQSYRDRITLQHLHASLQRALAPLENTAAALPHVTYLAEPHGERQRVVLLDNHRLAQGHEFRFVGYVGSPSVPESPRSLVAQDAFLLKLLRQHRQVLSYSQLADRGAYAHLLVGIWRNDLPFEPVVLHQLFQTLSDTALLYTGLLTLNSGDRNTLHFLHTQQAHTSCCTPA